MWLGCLWLSILNTTASPSPISMTPAFSPGPWITQDALVGSVRRWILEDLYEQCSFHIAEKMPSSVNVGTRPISSTRRAYSSGLSPCSAIRSGVMGGSLRIKLISLAAQDITDDADNLFSHWRSSHVAIAHSLRSKQEPVVRFAAS